jgi:hypothetical protein
MNDRPMTQADLFEAPRLTPETIAASIARELMERVERDECDADILTPGYSGIIRRTLAALSGKQREQLYESLTPRPSRQFRRHALEKVIDDSVWHTILVEMKHHRPRKYRGLYTTTEPRP